MAVEVRRAEDRFLTSWPGVVTRSALSTGAHWDPARTAVGPLVAVDEHALDAGAGFPPHRHRDLVVLTWVLEGQLDGTDSTGRRTVLPPGRLQVLHAGAGVEHEERSAGEPVRFLQAWLLPDDPGGPVGHALVEPAPAGLVALASGRGHPGALPLRCGSAALHLATVTAAPQDLPPAPTSYVHVLDGRVDVGGEALGAGDAAVVHGPHRLGGSGRALVWELDVWELDVSELGDGGGRMPP